MDILNELQQELGIARSQAEAAVKLIDEGNTIPFIARYQMCIRDSNKRVHRTEGTGLGMAIKKYIIDQMGGTIEVKSEQNKGSAVSYTHLDVYKRQSLQYVHSLR